MSERQFRYRISEFGSLNLNDRFNSQRLYLYTAVELKFFNKILRANCLHSNILHFREKLAETFWPIQILCACEKNFRTTLRTLGFIWQSIKTATMFQQFCVNWKIICQSMPLTGKQRTHFHWRVLSSLMLCGELSLLKCCDGLSLS